MWQQPTGELAILYFTLRACCLSSTVPLVIWQCFLIGIAIAIHNCFFFLHWKIFYEDIWHPPTAHCLLIDLNANKTSHFYFSPPGKKKLFEKLKSWQIWKEILSGNTGLNVKVNKASRCSLKKAKSLKFQCSKKKHQKYKNLEMRWHLKINIAGKWLSSPLL